MDDVWLGLGATHADVEACLAALALFDKGRPPLLAVAAGGETPRLLLASRALFRLFGVETGEALSTRLLDGPDPGARRLGALCRTLSLESAPRLERLRFFMGPGTEVITFLCRRISASEGPLFVAAALGVRAGQIADLPPALTASVVAPHPALAAAITLATPEPTPLESTRSEAPAPDSLAPPLSSDFGADAKPVSTVAPESSAPMPPMGVQSIQATLRSRYPSSRTVRFLWQSDADLVCTQVTPPLAEIVGANGDILGRNLLELAPHVDPSGRLADALASRKTWSGIDVSWPMADAAAGVVVGLGAIPSQDRERSFDGYRGYGVIHLDRIAPRAPVQFAPKSTPAGDAPDPTRQEDERLEPGPAEASRSSAAPNVVRFPGAKALSAEDEKAFTTLGLELREEAGLAKTGSHPLQPVKPTPEPAETTPTPPATSAADRRAADVARHGLAMLDRLAVGILVSRDNVPIFANRQLLDSLGFADEDALHEAGGMARLFGDQPGNTTGSEAVGVRGRDGRIIATQTRMQTIDWDGLPATLLTLHPVGHAMDIAPQMEPVEAQSVEAKTVDTQTAAQTIAGESDDAELRELRAILETATDGVAVIDADCNVVSLNRSGEALFGCDRGDVIGKSFLSLFAAHNQGLASDYLDGLKSNPTKRLLNDGREFLVNAHRGGTIPVFMTLGRLESTERSAAQNGNGLRFCALFRDLTHWKKVERDLEAARQDAERANDLKSDFLTKVSHEIRTPLNAIIGFAEMMMEERFGPVGNERYKDYLRDIHASGTHVMSLVNDLLDLSKIEAGKMELAIEPIDVNKVVGECVALMQPQASRERVIMRLSLAPGLPQIKADQRSLRQIALNILSNAVKYNEPGGQVIVATARTEAGQVVIRIRDTGPGMSDDDIATALQPFRQLATSRPTGGTGLGLPLTKALVEANEAAFSIRSKLAQGTLVEVAFPPARVLAD